MGKTPGEYTSKRICTHPYREARRAEAIIRQAKRDSRSTDQQLRLIAKRPGRSQRETARLVATRLIGGMK